MILTAVNETIKVKFKLGEAIIADPLGETQNSGFRYIDLTSDILDVKMDSLSRILFNKLIYFLIRLSKGTGCYLHFL